MLCYAPCDCTSDRSTVGQPIELSCALRRTRKTRASQARQTGAESQASNPIRALLWILWLRTAVHHSSIGLFIRTADR